MKYFNVVYFILWGLFILTIIYFRPIGICGTKPFIDEEGLMNECNVTREQLVDLRNDNSSFCPQYRDFFGIESTCSNSDKIFNLSKNIIYVSLIYNLIYAIIFSLVKYLMFLIKKHRI